MKAIHKIAILTLISLPISVYLFISAPPELPDQKQVVGAEIPVDSLFQMLAHEQNVARTLYTKRIVGPGIKTGLHFDENWTNDGVEAGPLPALFLRETAKQLRSLGSKTTLFLGSEFPIASSNKFSGTQLENFRTMKTTGDPAFFFDSDSGMHTAMFVDPASSAACVSCHNEHPNSPKTDWKLSDAMGATTWIYPEETVDLVTALRELKMLREATALAYTGYLEKASEFASPPVDIGEKWPAEGAFLPSAPAFMSALDAEVGAASFDILLQTIGD